MKRLALVLLMVIAAGCDDTRGMETRTYKLLQLSLDQAFTLFAPYLRSGGTIAGKDSLITVREKPDRLKVIEDLLKKYDGGGDARDIMLHVQVVQADGFTQRDSALAAIEPLLRRTFRFKGFRTLGQTDVRVREQGTFSQSQHYFTVSGRALKLENAAGETRLPLQITLVITQNDRTGLLFGDQMSTTVTTMLGKPMVLGKNIEQGAIILIITPSLASM